MQTGSDHKTLIPLDLQLNIQNILRQDQHHPPLVGSSNSSSLILLVGEIICIYRRLMMEVKVTRFTLIRQLLLLFFRRNC